METMKTLNLLTKQIVESLKEQKPELFRIVEEEDLKQEICTEALAYDLGLVTTDNWGEFYAHIYNDIIEKLSTQKTKLDSRQRVRAIMNAVIPDTAPSIEQVIIDPMVKESSSDDEWEKFRRRVKTVLVGPVTMDDILKALQAGSSEFHTPNIF